MTDSPDVSFASEVKTDILNEHIKENSIHLHENSNGKATELYFNDKNEKASEENNQNLKTKTILQAYESVITISNHTNCFDNEEEQVKINSSNTKFDGLFASELETSDSNSLSSNYPTDSTDEDKIILDKENLNNCKVDCSPTFESETSTLSAHENESFDDNEEEKTVINKFNLTNSEQINDVQTFVENEHSISTSVKSKSFDKDIKEKSPKPKTNIKDIKNSYLPILEVEPFIPHSQENLSFCEEKITPSSKEIEHDNSTKSKFQSKISMSHDSNSLNDNKKKSVNGFKPAYNDSKVNLFDRPKQPRSETWTFNDDSQFWIENCQYNKWPTNGKIGYFQPNAHKLNYNHYAPSSCPSCSSNKGIPCRHTGRYNNNSMNFNGNNQQHIVHLHVNPGETVSFYMGDHMQLIQGPATVRMVSNNSTPPVPMPVQVPPGHMIQQIVDEQGTLKHIILSPQPPLGVNNPYNAGSVSGNLNSPSTSGAFYLYHNPSFSLPIQYPHHMQPIIPGQRMHASNEHIHSQQNDLHSPPQGASEISGPSHYNAFKDERTQRQFIKLKKRLEARQKEVNVPHPFDNGASEKNSDEVHHNLKYQGKNEKVDKQLSKKDCQIIEALSTIKSPSITEITVTSALLKWNPLELDKENEDFKELEIKYVVLLSDKNKDNKPKSVYKGNLLEYNLNGLKPATTYYVSIFAESNTLSGKPSESMTFKTLSCKPEPPQPPKLLSRTKTSIFLKWNAAVDNGSKITSYLLEYDEGKESNDFVELFNGLQKQYKAVKLKTSTCYRFRLAAINEHGKSLYSEISCFSTSGSAPSQPLPVVLKTAFVNQLSLSWESRPNDDSYTLQMEDEATFHGFLPVYNGKDTSYTSSGLRRNSFYKFRLCACNDEGASPWSQVSKFSTLPDKPDKPGKPYVKGRPHSSFLKLTWDPPKDDGGCPITCYNLEMDSGTGFNQIYSGNELEFHCDNLQPGKTYNFRVNCSSDGGTSAFSDIAPAMTLPVVPGKCQPPKLQGKPKPLILHLKWFHPDYDGGSEVLESEIEITYPDKTSRLAYKGPSNDCAVAGLQPGCQYQFRVRAYNKVGAGPWSDYFEATSGAGVPDMPKDVTAVPRSPHCIFVTWSEPANNGAVITEYKLEYKNDESDFEMVYSGPHSSAEVKSLIPATTYYFQVQAVNSSGPSPYSEIVEAITSPSSPGSIVNNNIRCIVGSTTVALSWQEPNNNGSPILSYNVEVGDHIYSTDGDKPEICIENLSPETTYKIRIQAINIVGPGSFCSPIKVITRGLPPLPPIIECTGSSHNSLRLKWGDGKNFDLKTYTLELENQQTNKFVPIYQGTYHTFKVSKLQELTSYNFRIYASNEEGDGHYSPVYSFKTQRALPSALKAPKVTSITETSCLVEWAPAKVIGEDKLSYKLHLDCKKAISQTFNIRDKSDYSLHHLMPNTEYSVRVAAIRHCNDGDFVGPFSPFTEFSTIPYEETKSQPPKLISVVNTFKERQPLTDQQWALIILLSFTFFAVIVAIIIQKILSTS